MTARKPERRPSERSLYVHVDEEDAAILGTLAAQIDEILSTFRIYSRGKRGWAISPDSRAEIERGLMAVEEGPGGKWDGHAVDYAADSALLFLQVQRDHLAVLQQILSTYEGLMYGVAPPVRSLLEIDGFVHWLLHPDVVDIRVRAARVLLAQLKDAHRELVTAKALRAPMRVITPLQSVHEHLKQQMGQQFYAGEWTHDKYGNPVLLGEKHPGPGEALLFISRRGYEPWNSNGAYAFLSNATHPTLHTVLDTIQPETEEAASHFGRPDTVFYEKLGRMAITGFLATWLITATYRGVDTGPLQALLESFQGPKL